MRTCTSLAPAPWTSFTISRSVVPRTMLSSINTIRFPSMTLRMGFNFTRTASRRFSGVDMINVRAIYLFLIRPSSNGMPTARANTSAAVREVSGTGMTTSASTGCSLASCSPSLFRTSKTGTLFCMLSGRAKYTYSNMQCRTVPSCSRLRTSFPSQTTTSPPLISPWYGISLTSSATLSEANATYSSFSPYTIGRIACLSRNATSFPSTNAVMENAPSTLSIRFRTPFKMPFFCAISIASTSLSAVLENSNPCSFNSSRKLSPLAMCPLCAIAMFWYMNGCTSAMVIRPLVG